MEYFFTWPEIHDIKRTIAFVFFFDSNSEDGKTKGNKQRYHIKYCDVHTLFKATNAKVCKNMPKKDLEPRKVREKIQEQIEVQMITRNLT